MVAIYPANDVVGKARLVDAGMVHCHMVQLLAARAPAAPPGCVVGRRHYIVEQATQLLATIMPHMDGALDLSHRSRAGAVFLLFNIPILLGVLPYHAGPAWAKNAQTAPDAGRRLIESVVFDYA